MGIKDRNINRKRHVDYIPASQLSSLQYLAVSTSLASSGSGDPLIGEVGALALNGARLATLTDLVHHDFPFPEHMDIKEDIKIRAVFMQSGATSLADSVTFTALYSQFADDSQVTLPATALGTPIPAKVINDTNSDAIRRTDWGVIPASTLTQGDLFRLSIGITANSGIDVTVDSVYLLGIEIQYLPNLSVDRV